MIYTNTVYTCILLCDIPLTAFGVFPKTPTNLSPQNFDGRIHSV